MKLPDTLSEDAKYIISIGVQALREEKDLDTAITMACGRLILKQEDISWDIYASKALKEIAAEYIKLVVADEAID